MKILNYRHDFDYSYALGMTLVIEMFSARPELLEHVFVSSSTERNERYANLASLCEAHGIPIEQNEKAFNVLSPKGNCFAIGVFKKFKQKLTPSSCVVLVNPSDSGNLGTMIRTAVGFGVDNLALISPAVDIFDPKTVRASMGALFHINYKYFVSFDEYMAEHNAHSYYPFMLGASTPLRDVVFKKPYSLIFGNEATGLPASFASLPNATPVVIPHSKDIDSLNLTMACGIALYEASRSEFS